MVHSGWKFLLITGCILFFGLNGFIVNHAYSAPAKIWVSPDGDDQVGNGSENSPYKTINFAVSNVAYQDTIVLKSGIYPENVIIQNKSDFILHSNDLSDPAIIQAEQNGAALLINQAQSVATRAMVIEHIIISHQSGFLGAGIEILNSALTLRNCIIRNNKNTENGGGIKISNVTSRPLIENNSIEFNEAVSGAGIFCENMAVEVHSNTFNNNVSENNGGAAAFIDCYNINFNQNTVFLNQASYGAAVFIGSGLASLNLANQFKNNMIYQNEATIEGGAFYATGNALISTSLFEQNTIAENHSQGNGGAMVLKNTSNVLLRQNIIVRNEAAADGGGLAFYDMGLLSQINLWANTITGNKAGANGGGIFLQNVNYFAAGGADNLANNLFNNRDFDKLSNIYAASSVNQLFLNRNYWGSRDQLAISQQLEIPNLGDTWTQFETAPIDVRLKLFRSRKNLWFADGKIEFISGLGLNPVGDSTLVVQTHPDTSFSVSGIASVLRKIYSFKWNGVRISSGEGILQFNLTNADLNILGDPPIDDLRILGKSDTLWIEKATTRKAGDIILSTPLDNLLTPFYTIGSNLKALDTVLSVIPKANKADYDKFSPIEIAFKNSMIPASLNKQNILIHGSNSGNRELLIDYDTARNILNLQINNGLQSGETVTVTLTDSIKQSNGKNLPGNSWQFITSAFRGSGNFQPAMPVQRSQGAWQYLFNDFNGDQVPELVELSDELLTIYSKQNDGQYILQKSENLDNTYHHMRLADLNNDNTNEIVLFDDAGFVAYEYDTISGFNPSFTDAFTGGGTLNDVKIADFNNDGVQDMAFLIDTKDFRQFECHYGALDNLYSFSGTTSFFLNGQSDKLAMLDWNSNGVYDLVASNGSAQTNIAMIINDKNSFRPVINPITEIISQNIFTTANVWESFLFPNQKEIIIAGGTSSNFDVLKLYNVDSNGDLIQTYRKSFDVGVSISQVLAADFNADGFNDLAVSFNDSTITLLLSNSLGHLVSEKTVTPVQLNAHKMAAVDFDADGDLDLFAAQNEDGAISWRIMENISRNPRSWWVNGLASFGDGSFLNPFTNINDAISRSFEDDSVFVAGRTYNENIKIRHSLFLSSQDFQPVRLNSQPNDRFSRAVVDISGVRNFSLQNFEIANYESFAPPTGLFTENSDSLDLHGVRIVNFDQGIVSSNTKMWLRETEIHDNGLNTQNGFGISLSNGSVMNISQGSVSRNGRANILMNNSSLSTYFTLIGETTEDNSPGSGIIATEGSSLDLQNSVLFNNGLNGIELDNSEVVILNSIFAYNDSLFENNGSGLVLENGSLADISNTIFFANNTAITSDASTVNSNYNDFYSNNSGDGWDDGEGNLAVNPLLVFMYNPTGPLQELDGFDNAKLAAGSQLIDKGNPQLTNGNSASRSDIGLYGNLGLPFAFETIPQPFLKKRDSLITISWQGVQPAEEKLWAGTIIFRDTLSSFEPDTSKILKYLIKSVNSYDDKAIEFGREYYYRLAFVDTNGAAYAYTTAMQGRIDFKEISVEFPELVVQLKPGDRLTVPIEIINSGTLPVNVIFDSLLPSWLTVQSQVLNLQRGEKGQAAISFNANGLADEQHYLAKVEFKDSDESLIKTILNVRMILSAKDILAPQTKLFTDYPDTVKQASLSFLFSGDDSTYSTVGSPVDLLKYNYRFTDLSGSSGPALGTTIQNRLDFFPLADGRYRFEVAALDTAGNGGLSKNRKFVNLVLKASEMEVTPQLWQMMTVPRNIFNTGIQVNSNAIASLRQWQQGAYKHVNADSLQPGYSYWIFSTQKLKFDLNSYPIVEANRNYTIQLNEGWNMIGNPWSWNISWDNLMFSIGTGSQMTFNEAVGNEIDAGIYSWNASLTNQGYVSKTASMKTNTGYWIKAKRAMSLSFNPAPSLPENESLQKSSTLVKVPLHDAMVQLKIKRGAQVDYENYFGVCMDKQVYPPFYRKAAEAPSIAGSRLFSKVDGQFLAANLVLFSEIDSVYTWEIVVERALEGNETALLSWQNLNKESGVKFYLYHLESAQWFNLDEDDILEIDNAKVENHFKLYATENADFRPDILPVKFSLSQNYPNPFNPQTTIEFSIPYFADGIKTRLDVFDVLGRRVKNLLNRKVESGTVKITWNGLNEKGAAVASGIYFYQINAGDFVKSKKMILIK